jgi:hypothetical protein
VQAAAAFDLGQVLLLFFVFFVQSYPLINLHFPSFPSRRELGNLADVIAGKIANIKDFEGSPESEFWGFEVFGVFRGEEKRKKTHLFSFLFPLFPSLRLRHDYRVDDGLPLAVLGVVERWVLKFWGRSSLWRKKKKKNSPGKKIFSPFFFFFFFFFQASTWALPTGESHRQRALFAGGGAGGVNSAPGADFLPCLTNVFF